ncbi:uncharacterized protein LOC111335801 [Stylophora pistillata]|uniref:uncharacterized protein LOC111335801 n=1 Tax=Stylophora pistillata TaxID=50429 RepID=UPI000C03B7E8|nr:uncharacterized protein LOC111335801 [Stylophora pistillata]
MNTLLSRLNTIFAFTLTVLAALIFLCFLRTLFKIHQAPLHLQTKKVLVKNVQDFSVSKDKNDLGFITFDLEGDMKGIFNWNVKQLFLYLTAEYTTKKNIKEDSCIAELKDKVAAALTNNEELEKVVSKLKEKVVDLERKYEKCEERLLSFKNIASNDSLVAFYTGFPNYQTMMALYDFLGPGEQGENINYWLSGKGFDSTPKSVKKEDHGS